jgi:hypothetical protein
MIHGRIIDLKRDGWVVAIHLSGEPEIPVIDVSRPFFREIADIDVGV